MTRFLSACECVREMCKHVVVAWLKHFEPHPGSKREFLFPPDELQMLGFPGLPTIHVKIWMEEEQTTGEDIAGVLEYTVSG